MALIESQLTYESATVAMPGTLALTKTDRGPKAVGSSVRFMRNDFYISVNIPTGIFESVQIKGDFVQPLADLVSADLETIDALLSSFEVLSENGSAPKELMYCRNPQNNSPYKVFDNHSTPPGQVMDILLAIKNTDKRVLNPAYADLLSMAANVSQEEKKLVHVQGNNLNEAVGRAIAIYNLADRLRNIKS